MLSSDGEFHSLGRANFAAFGVHAEQWGYYKLIHLEGTLLTRIDGMMILGMPAGGCSPRRCGPTMQNCVCRAAESVSYRRWSSTIAGFARVWRWVTSPPSGSRSSLLHAWFLRWRPLSAPARRPLYVAADISHTGEKCKVSPRLPLTQKPDQQDGVSGSVCWSYRHDWLGVINGNASPKLGLAMLFRRRVWAADERAQICFTRPRDLWISGRAHMAAIIFGMAVSHWYFQLRAAPGVAPKIMWASLNAIIGDCCSVLGIVLAALRNRLDVPRSAVCITGGGLGNVIGSTIPAYYWMISRPRWRPVGIKLTC